MLSLFFLILIAFFLLQIIFFYYTILHAMEVFFMDKIFDLNENLILNQLEHLSISEFDSLFDTITKEEL